MFIINVAEWCVEALVLSIAFFCVAAGIILFAMIISITKQTIDRWINEKEKSTRF